MVRFSNLKSFRVIEVLKCQLLHQIGHLWDRVTRNISEFFVVFLANIFHFPLKFNKIHQKLCYFSHFFLPNGKCSKYSNRMNLSEISEELRQFSFVFETTEIANTPLKIIQIELLIHRLLLI